MYCVVIINFVLLILVLYTSLFLFYFFVLDTVESCAYCNMCKLQGKVAIYSSSFARILCSQCRC